MIEYRVTKKIYDNDLRPLYESVGWSSYTNELPDLSALITNSHLVISAWNNKQLIGLIRTVGDGVSIQYVQDILVLPTYQNQGIGSNLFQQVLEHSKNIRQFVLMTDASVENQATIKFYEKHGLRRFEDTQICGLWRMA